jgi:ATP-dependent phosphofructokinase / diphosphate-dependent phosphofructokinase
MDKTIGILTGDGDCPGLNAVIRAIVRKSLHFGNQAVGIRKSWKGILERDVTPLDINSVSDIIGKGGTILGSSRTNPFKYEGGAEKVVQHLRELHIDVLVVVGSRDALHVARRLYDEFQCPIIGIPKTIDNDLLTTDFTFGFHTAVATVTDALDRIHSTAESHDRVMILEVMGPLHRLDCYLRRHSRRRRLHPNPGTPVHAGRRVQADPKAPSAGQRFQHHYCGRGRAAAGD